MDQATLETIIRLVWLLGAAAFVFGLHQMNSPATARRGNQLSAGGMALAVIGTVALIASRGGVQTLGWPIIAAGVVVGGYVVTDRMLQMFRKKPAAPKAVEQAET